MIMSDVRAKVIEMLRVPQLAALATITTSGLPWTRYVMVQSDDGFKIRSAVSLDSRKVDQIAKNPEVHITFGINDPQTDLSKPYVQIQGRAKVVSDQAAKDAYWFDMLSMVFNGPDDPNYAVMIVEPYRVELNNPGEMVPEIWEK